MIFIEIWRFNDFQDGTRPSSPRMGSLKSPCKTSYWSSIETIAANCLVLEKIAFCVRDQTTQRDEDKEREREKQTNKQTNGQQSRAAASQLDS